MKIKGFSLEQIRAMINSKLAREGYEERRRAFNDQRVHRHPASLKAHRRSKLKRRS